MWAALAERLDRVHQRVMDNADSDYIRQGRSWRDERRHEIEQPQPLIVLEAKFNAEVRNLIKENRIQMTERFTLRTDTPRRSIRVTERSIRAPAAPTETEPEPGSALDTLFTNIIDTTVRYSLGSASSEPGQEVRRVAFDISWELQECIRQELDENVDLAPVLTVTGKENAWATTCHGYVRTTWDELGEQFLVELEILLGKKLDTAGQYDTRKRIPFEFFS